LLGTVLPTCVTVANCPMNEWSKASADVGASSAPAALPSRR
jgi:hypothetical protein